MNLHEDAENNVVTATFELPGLAKDNVSIDVHNGRLTISGEIAESSERDQDGYKIKERRSGKFSRTLQLPEGTQVNVHVWTLSKAMMLSLVLQPDAIKASMQDGVLTVAFPRLSLGEEPQRIAIS